ncbi:MAG: anthranilate synthase component I family protein [Flavobacteriaceae bacterium]|nr:anthranilate synthase component I family protein [Flavobacteriaceae bacterium]
MRFVKKYSFSLNNNFKEALLHWAQQFDEVVWLDSNQHQQKHSNYKAILAVDAFTAIKTDYFNAFDQLEEYQFKTKDWLFGYLTYDLKNDVEKLQSNNFDVLHFPDLYFFQPKKIFLFSENEVEIQYLHFVDDELDADWQEIIHLSKNPHYFKPECLCEDVGRSKLIKKPESPIKIHLRTSKDSYFKKLSKMLDYIHKGDIYEANFCQEFYSENTSIDPEKTFIHLNEISKTPFATFLKLGIFYTLSASPERYISKTGNTIISQPIKGTAKRHSTKSEDDMLKIQLENDPKERSENIMITDLVRNDLSRFAKKGTVKVEELCKVYSFEQVHQMISTITCEVEEIISPVKIIKETFPMGSMTGAPKISAMKIIEELEDAKRGLYSGAVGYFTPDNDFDFNVIIRSILYNSDEKYVSFSVGGAITAKSIPENEYEECLLKAKAMREVLEN